LRLIFTIFAILCVSLASLSGSSIQDTNSSFVIQNNIDNSRFIRSKESDEQSSIWYIIAALLSMGLILYAFRKISTQKAKSIGGVRVGEYLKTDLHSHLMPDIDDGVDSLEESIAIIREFEKLGYTKLIVTPHIMSHRYPNSSKIILAKLRAVNNLVVENRINIELEASAEYFLDDHLIELIAQRDILTFADNYLLFELSYASLPINLDSMIEFMIEHGYRPVLAHPERYLYMIGDIERYRSLKRAGVLFQLNINSLAGYYSEEVKRFAQILIDKGMIDFVGSDTHHMRHFKTMQQTVKTDLFRSIFQKNNILNQTL